MPIRIFLLLAIAALAAGCREPLLQTAGTHARSARELARLDEDEIDLGAAALVMARDVDPRVSINAGLRLIDALARGLAPIVAAATSPEDTIGRMGEWLFNEKNLYSWVPDTDRWRASLVSELLNHHRGDCVALSFLYLALAERLGLPLGLVTMPGHALVAWVEDGEARFYIETTRRAPVRASLDYLDERLGPDLARQRGPFQGRPLGKRAALGVLMQQWGVALMEQGRAAEADTVFAMSAEINPADAATAFHRARLKERMGLKEAAEVWFAEAARLNDTFADALIRLALIRLDLGRPAQAADALARATALLPENPSLRLLYAQALEDAGHPAAAEAQRNTVRNALPQLEAEIEALRREMGQ